MIYTTCNIIWNSVSGMALLVLLTIVASCETVIYYLKFVTFMVSAATLTTVCIPFMLWRIGDWRNALLPAKGITIVAKLLGITFQIRGKENIVKDSGCIVLINHQSALDLCVLGELWPVMKNSTVIAKKEVLYFGTFGLASWLWGTLFIDRQKGGEAKNAVNSTADAIKNRKMKLLVFPEGHRHSGRSLLPFKKGAFHLAIAAQVPVQPVVVSKYHFVNSKAKRFNSGSSYITILPPISTEGLTKDDLPKLVEKTYEVMNNSFQETSQETLSKYVDSLKDD